MGANKEVNEKKKGEVIGKNIFFTYMNALRGYFLSYS